MTPIRATGFALLLVLVAGDARACSCGQLTVNEAYVGYPLIFDGTVETVEDQSSLMRSAWAMISRLIGRDTDDERYESNYGFRVVFKAGTVWKGTASSSVAVFTGRGDGDCGIRFHVGRKYLVYAYGPQPASGLCTRTAPLERAQADLTFLSRATARLR